MKRHLINICKVSIVAGEKEVFRERQKDGGVGFTFVGRWAKDPNSSPVGE